MSGERADSRLLRLVGEEGLERLRQTKVAVLGLGGVGSNCAEALARGGIGHLVLVDRDAVEASNINRQAIAFHSTVGRRKVEVMREMVVDIDPSIEVTACDRFIVAENVSAFFDEHGQDVDYVIDAIDTVSAKLALAEYAVGKPFKLISSMGAANKIHPECLRFADIFETVNCPLCRIVRKEARKRGIDHLRVLYSDEIPVAVQVAAGAERRDRTNLGTVSFMPPIMGQMIAGAVIREVAGLGDGS